MTTRIEPQPSPAVECMRGLIVANRVYAEVLMSWIPPDDPLHEQVEVLVRHITESLRNVLSGIEQAADECGDPPRAVVARLMTDIAALVSEAAAAGEKLARRFPEAP